MKTFYDKVFNATIGIEIAKPSRDVFDAESGIEEKQVKGGTLRRYVVTLQNRKDFYALIHETIHVVKNVFTDRGIPFTAENHEMIAYYQSYLFETLWRAINKPSGKKKG